MRLCFDILEIIIKRARILKFQETQTNLQLKLKFIEMEEIELEFMDTVVYYSSNKIYFTEKRDIHRDVQYIFIEDANDRICAVNQSLLHGVSDIVEYSY